jgi:hypothetical protein
LSSGRAGSGFRSKLAHAAAFDAPAPGSGVAIALPADVTMRQSSPAIGTR